MAATPRRGPSTRSTAAAPSMRVPICGRGDLGIDRSQQNSAGGAVSPAPSSHWTLNFDDGEDPDRAGRAGLQRSRHHGQRYRRTVAETFPGEPPPPGAKVARRDPRCAKSVRAVPSPSPWQERMKANHWRSVAVVLVGALGPPRCSDSTQPGNAAPVANFTSSCTDLDCTFTDLSSDTDGTVQSYSWSFGDGGTVDHEEPGPFCTPRRTPTTSRSR